ncbi:MAG: hypothetical protein AB8B87_03415 [Granulosicoccus sp.]
MTQQRQVPTQIQVDSFTAKAKALRAEVLASQSVWLFQLPARTMKNLAAALKIKKPADLV